MFVFVLQIPANYPRDQLPGRGGKRNRNGGGNGGKNRGGNGGGNGGRNGGGGNRNGGNKGSFQDEIAQGKVPGYNQIFFKF